MKNIIFLLALTMNCQIVKDTFSNSIMRCENDEVICYAKKATESSLFCKFKDDVLGD